MLGIDDAGQFLGEFDHPGNVHHASDIDAAVTHEHADSRRFAPDISFLRVRLGDNRGPPGLGDHAFGRGGGARRLHYRFRYVLGAAGRTAHEYPGPARRDRRKGRSLEELVLVQLDVQLVGKDRISLPGLEPDREHHHVELLAQLPRIVLRGVVDEQVPALWDFQYLAHPGPDETHAVLVLCPVVERIEVLAVGADVHEEYGRRNLFDVLFGDGRFLDGVHTADRRAVAPVFALIPAADTLYPGDSPGNLAVVRPLDVTGKRPGSGQYPFELDAGHDILAPAVSELVLERRAELLRAIRDDDRPDIERQLLFLLVEVNRIRLTKLLAYLAVAGLQVDAMLGIDRGVVRDCLRVGNVYRRPFLKALVELGQNRDGLVVGDFPKLDTLGRAYGKARPTGLADIRLDVECRLHEPSVTSAREPDCSFSHPVAAHADAETAKQAVLVLQRNPRLADAHLLGQTFDLFGVRAPRQQQFYHYLAGLLHARSVGLDNQPILGRVSTGRVNGRRSALSAHLDQAEPTGTIGGQRLVVAQGRYLHAGFFRRLEY